MTIDEVRRSAGDSFDAWLHLVDQAYRLRFGGAGMDDFGDAPWADYFADDMSPLDAMAHALIDWQDAGDEIVEAIGLGGRV